MNSESCIFLAGASRGVGREIANCLRGGQVKVRALLRSPSSGPELERMGIEIVMGDALDLAAVEQAVTDGPAISAMISTIGGLPKDGQRADYLGNRNLIDAAVKANVGKFILISSIGSGQSAVALPPQAMETLKSVLIEKEKAEEHLINSGLTYTIIRPGGLKSEPATGNGVLTEDYRVAGTIHRADVAALACACLHSDQANNKILSAIDRQMAYGQTDFEVLDI
ncbi:MAG: SDR family oxidoreductase [Limnospira sp. PMC 1291.21]|uniref:NAD-dependent epimerase/dehydratase n=3 Tax=Limnospira TaxID=2596745 RepID=A0A9P1P301_9CYAN|nr:MULTISPECIES: SDR family oxidoreductase [Limnospira]EKD08647.1 NAD-dependent epimerase/dehydratase [Arthrospira platensis C1]MDC0838455.1 SDR family oxidoreductase [Limnoraphis robusta]MDY7051485.1 SDR family oxidoreductase [Limnospira fusiformis LS22]QJB29129.1 SDR family oxidoreductase [Limnospira fusiformis SAG 85.79]RAQ47577.1 NAD(P)-dependent oxidoreductase [Arthrospira sp. O9.13F]